MELLFNMHLETFCVHFQSHLIVIQLLSHRLPPFFFFFSASHLRVDTYSCFLCRISRTSGIGQHGSFAGTDATHPEVQTSSERQCFSSHLVLRQWSAERSQQEQVPISHLIMPAFSPSHWFFLSSLFSASLNHIPNKLLVTLELGSALGKPRINKLTPEVAIERKPSRQI